MEGVIRTPSIGHFNGDQPDDAVECLNRDGVVAFDGLWPVELISRLEHALRNMVPGAYNSRAPQPEDFLEVDTDRINGLVPVAGAMRECIDLLLHPTLLKLCEQMLGKDWVFESFGVISSFPGAPLQEAHEDSPPLLDGGQLADALPTFALTISIPLVPVDAINGSTEFLIGTHRAAAGATRSDTFVTSWLSPGDCMVWDFMVRHRGQANHGTTARPLLYITACRKFWLDSTNFRPDARKLVLDHKAWTLIPQPQHKRFVRARSMPGPRSAARTLIRLSRWYAPGLHRAIRRLVRRPERIR